MKQQQIQSIQALRFVAAMLVVVTHSTLYAHHRLDSTFPVWETGTFGVNIFFVISGFVMYLTAKARSATDGAWLDFGLRRIIRIVPLYWLFTTISLLVVLVIPSLAMTTRTDPAYLLSSYFLIPAFASDGKIEPLLGVGWTLIYEMFFYALCCVALLMRLSIFYFCAAVLVGLAALSPLVQSALAPLQQNGWAAFAFYFDYKVLDFLLGMVIGRFVVLRSLPAWSSVFLIALGVTWWIIVDPYAKDLNTIIARGVPAFFIVVGAIAIEKWIAGRMPKSLLTLGAASYALYLCHPIVAPAAPEVLRRLGVVSPLLSVIMSIALSLTACIVVHFLIEQPVTRLLNRVLERKSRTLLAEPQPGLLSRQK